MTIFVVYEYDYEGGYFREAFTTLKLAEDYIKSDKRQHRTRRMDVHEYKVLDAIPEHTS
jgi:hypothetical protein